MKQGIAEQVVNSYEIIAERHLSKALEGVHTNFYERPAMRSLLGDVQGKRVLDAGCGHGSNTDWLIAHGANVIAIDSTPRLVQLARERFGASVEIRLADLNEPLFFCAADSFDIVLCSLVLDYIEDWETLFKEFHRLLVELGRLVFSVHHPFFLDLKVDAHIEDSYFLLERLEEDWLPFGLKIPAFRRPLGAMSSALWNAGFVIEQIIEPKPTEECKQAYPKYYERLSKHPVFICFGARKAKR